MEKQSSAVSSSTGREFGPSRCGRASELWASWWVPVPLNSAGWVQEAGPQGNASLREDLGQAAVACGSSAGTKCWFHSYCKCQLQSFLKKSYQRMREVLRWTCCNVLIKLLHSLSIEKKTWDLQMQFLHATLLEIENKGTFEFTIFRIQWKTNILAKMSNFSFIPS